MRYALVALLTWALLSAGCRSYRADEVDAHGSRPAPADAGVARGTPAGEGATSGAGAREARRADDPFTSARDDIARAHELPLPAGNYRIEVERIWVGEEDRLALSAMFRYADEDVVVEGGSPLPESGLRVGVAKGGFQGALQAMASSTRGTTREQAFLVTVAGYPARIDVGVIRYAAPFSVPGGSGVVIFPGGQQVGTSLQAVVTPLGQGAAQVELTPVFSAFGGGDMVAVTSMSTAVVAPLGQPLLIGSHERSHDDVATALFSRTTSSGREQAVIVLRVIGG